MSSPRRLGLPTTVRMRHDRHFVDQLARRLVRRARADTINADDAAVTVARRMAARFPNPPQVNGVRFVTNQRARWGSYSTRTGMVRLSAALRQLPSWVLEAVVAHELAHSFYADHSPAFWELLRGVCPKTDRARAFLEGVSWISERWRDLPPVERSQLSRSDGGENSEFGMRNSEPDKRNTDPGPRNSDSGIRNSECGIRKDEAPANQRLPLDFE